MWIYAQRRPVVPEGARGAMTWYPRFWLISLPYHNQGDRLFPDITTGTPGFTDLLTALYSIYRQKK